MRTQAPETQGGRRTVAGKVASDGSIGFGTGFIATRTALGQYTVRFTPPFRSNPTVTTTGTVSGNTGINVLSVAPDAATFLTYATNTLAAGDNHFLFTAVGP